MMKFNSLGTKRSLEEENEDLKEILLFFHHYFLFPKLKRDSKGKVIPTKDENGKRIARKKIEIWQFRAQKIKDPNKVKNNPKPTVNQILDMPPKKVAGNIYGFADLSYDQQKTLTEWQTKCVTDKIQLDDLDVVEDYNKKPPSDSAVKSLDYNKYPDQETLNSLDC